MHLHLLLLLLKDASLIRIMDGVGYNQCLFLPKAELKTKNETKPPLLNGLLKSFLIFNSLRIARIGLITKNETKQEVEGCRLVSFLVFNSALGRHKH